MSKNIKFTAMSRRGYETQNRPVPATTLIPEWWKAMTPYDRSEKNPDGKKLFMIGGSANATFKKCTPMLDAVTSGYILTLHADVLVRQEEGAPGPSVTWRTNDPIFDVHGTGARSIPAPVGYDNVVFKYLNTWIPRTPPGYSIMVTAPFGYHDLPFRAVPAIVDSDKSSLELLPPMWLRDGFEGVIEKGTPLVQITPFKRESWTSSFDYMEHEDFEIMKEKNFNATLVNHYIKNHWSKKTYK